MRDNGSEAKQKLPTLAGRQFHKWFPEGECNQMTRTFSA